MDEIDFIPAPGETKGPSATRVGVILLIIAAVLIYAVDYFAFNHENHPTQPIHEKR